MSQEKFTTELFMSCPCHDGIIPPECQTPCYWYHNCRNNTSKTIQTINQDLNLNCSICGKQGNIKDFTYYCQKYNEYNPYKNNSPQATQIMAQQITNKKLTKQQRQLIKAILDKLMDED